MKEKDNRHTELIEWNGVSAYVIPLSEYNLSFAKEQELSKRISCLCEVTISNSEVDSYQCQNFSVKPALWKDRNVNYWFDSKDMCYEFNEKEDISYITAGKHKVKIVETAPLDNYNCRHQELLNNWKEQNQYFGDGDNNMILLNSECDIVSNAIKKNGYCNAHLAMRKQASILSSKLKEDLKKIPERLRYNIMKDSWELYKSYLGFRNDSRWRLYNDSFEVKTIANMLSIKDYDRIGLIVFKDLFDAAWNAGRRDRVFIDKNNMWPIINDMFEGMRYNDVIKKYKKMKNDRRN